MRRRPVGGVSGKRPDEGCGLVWKARMGITEYLLLVLVVVVPLVIASAVTLWSLKQVQYRPRKRRPPAAGPDRSVAETDDSVSPVDRASS